METIMHLPNQTRGQLLHAVSPTRHAPSLRKIRVSKDGILIQPLPFYAIKKVTKKRGQRKTEKRKGKKETKMFESCRVSSIIILLVQKIRLLVKINSNENQ